MPHEIIEEVVGNGKWVLRGTAEQNAILRPVFQLGDPSFIAFPWDRINNLPTFPVPIDWEDLHGDGGTFAKHVAEEGIIVADAGEPYPLNPHLIHVHREEQGHADSRPSYSDGKSARSFHIAGAFWPSGRIAIDIRQESNPDSAREVLSAEIAHAVDYGLPLSQSQKQAIMRLLHGGVADSHTWWQREDYDSEYNTLAGEAWMALFTHSYSGMEPFQDPFVHKSRLEMAPAVHQILGILPVTTAPSALELHGQIWHTGFHYTYVRLDWNGVIGDWVSILRNGMYLTTTRNDGTFYNFLGWRHGSFSYVLVDSMGRRSNEIVLTV